MKTIMVLDNNFTMRERITGLLTSMDYNVVIDTNSDILIDRIKKENLDPSLFLLDINLVHEDGFQVISKVKRILTDVPVVIMTSENKKSLFIRGIQAGAIDYILKPFQDTYFKDRISKLLEEENLLPDSYLPPTAGSNGKRRVVFDFHTYLQGELKKASKGNYNISVVLFLFYSQSELQNKISEIEYLNINSRIYDKFKVLIWDTDILVHYGPQSFIGIFPFSNDVTVEIIKNKMTSAFHSLQTEDPSMKDYKFFANHVIGSKEHNLKDVLLEELLKKTESNIREHAIVS